jgi:acid stress-induced BolA-like protein IbaG/YrbA
MGVLLDRFERKVHLAQNRFVSEGFAQLLDINSIHTLTL